MKILSVAQVAQAPFLLAKPETILIKDSGSFFMPYTKENIYARPYMVVKMDKKGKSIAERFALSYFSSIAVAIGFTIGDISQENPPVALFSASHTSLDNSLSISTFIPLQGNELWQFDLVRESFEVSFIYLKPIIAQQISYISQSITFKIGDLVLIPLSPHAQEVSVGDHYQVKMGEALVLSTQVE